MVRDRAAGRGPHDEIAARVVDRALLRRRWACQQRQREQGEHDHLGQWAFLGARQNDDKFAALFWFVATQKDCTK